MQKGSWEHYNYKIQTCPSGNLFFLVMAAFKLKRASAAVGVYNRRRN